jgi:hypothetical protein
VRNHIFIQFYAKVSKIDVATRWAYKTIDFIFS